MDSAETGSTGRRRAWLVALMAGLVFGSLVPWLAMLGIALAVALVISAAVSAPRTINIGGALVGLGLGSPILLLRANAACDPTDCEGPDLTPWLASAVAVALVGFLVSIAAWASSRRTSRQPGR